MNLNDIFNIEQLENYANFANANGYIILPLENNLFKLVDKYPLTEEEILDNLRLRRANECFVIINRGVLWYNTLTEEQRLELDKWYKEWLDITDTYRNAYEENPEVDIETIIPIKPTWLK